MSLSSPPIGTEPQVGASSADSVQPSSSSLEAELSEYLQLDPIPRSESLMSWWSANVARFPMLAGEAKSYLCAPPTSVVSERF